MLKSFGGRRPHQVGAFRKTVCLVSGMVMITGVTIGSAGAAIKPKQALANITIGLSSASIIAMPIWVAQADGYFAKEGLNVKVAALGSTAVVPALISGAATVDSLSNATFLVNRAAGLPIEAVSADSYGIPLGLILSNSFMQAHGITKQTPLATIAKDMIGSRGGSSAASLTGAVSALLQSYGESISQVTVATFGTTPAAQAAMEANQISWFAATEPSPYQVQQLGAGTVVASPLTVPAWSQKKVGYGQLITADTSFAAANPGLIRKIVSAIQAASKYLAGHEQKSLPVALANLTGVPRNLLFNSYRLITYATSGKMNANKWRSSVAFDIKSGILPHSFAGVKQDVDWTNKYI